jgi:hypothetical protein
MRKKKSLAQPRNTPSRRELLRRLCDLKQHRLYGVTEALEMYERGTNDGLYHVLTTVCIETIDFLDEIKKYLAEPGGKAKAA